MLDTTETWPVGQRALEDPSSQLSYAAPISAFSQEDGRYLFRVKIEEVTASDQLAAAIGV